MYSDPTKIRSHTVNVRLSDVEWNYLNALVDLTGGQLAAVVRELALEGATAILSNNAKPVYQVMEATNQSFESVS